MFNVINSLNTSSVLPCNTTVGLSFMQDWRRQLGIASKPQEVHNDEVE